MVAVALEIAVVVELPLSSVPFTLLPLPLVVDAFPLPLAAAAVLLPVKVVFPELFFIHISIYLLNIKVEISMREIWQITDDDMRSFAFY